MALSDDPETDRLAIRARLGDGEARQALISRFATLLFVPRGPDGRPLRPRRPLMDDEDLRQEAIRHFLELVDEFEPGRGVSFGAYVWKVLPWRLVNGLRVLADEVQAEPLEGFVLDEAAECQVVELDRPWEVDGEVALHEGLVSLSRQQRLVVALLYVQGLSAEQAAVRLGMTRRAINRLRQRAVDRLRRRVRRGSGI